MAGTTRSIIVSACDNSAPGQPYRPVGALVFQPEARLLGWHYKDDYDGPPLDPLHLDYRRGPRTFVLPINRALPSVFARMLTPAMRDGLVKQHPELAGAPDASLLMHIPLCERAGLRFEPQAIANDLDILNLQLEGGELEAMPSESRFHCQVHAFAEDLAALNETRRPQAFTLRDSSTLYRTRMVALGDDGSEWLAKLPWARRPHPDAVAIEATVLRTLEAAGFDVPETRLYSLNNTEPMLHVRRFDVDHGRRLFTLAVGEALGGAQPTYRAVRGLVRKVSTDWPADERRLAEAVVADATFNVVDNHPGNLTLIADGNGYRLSPLYDRYPSTTPGPFATRLSPGPLDLDEETTLARLADETGLPQGLLAERAGALRETVEHQLALQAVSAHLTSSGWRVLRQAIAVHQPALAASLDAQPPSTPLSRVPAPRQSAAPGPAPGP